MTKPLISVIVPCYNVEHFLPTCFKCLDRQTYKNLHVIFIDDGSTDGTLKLLQGYCALHPDYTLITGENRGVACARNSGLNAIKGELFAFCDADDIISDVHFELLCKNLIDSGADMSVCGVKRMSEKKAKKFDTAKRVKSHSVRLFDKKQALEQFFSQEIFDFLLVNKLYYTEIMRKSGACFLDNCHYGEESYFFCKYLLYAEKTVYFGAETYVYVQNKHSLMHSVFNEKRLDLYTNISAVLAEMSNYAEFTSVIPYIKIMRAGYSVGILYFILKSDYENACVIASIVNGLRNDVTNIRKCPKIALYKKIFMPIAVWLSSILFRKHLKQYPNLAILKTRRRVSAH